MNCFVVWFVIFFAFCSLVSALVFAVWDFRGRLRSWRVWWCPRPSCRGRRCRPAWGENLRECEIQKLQNPEIEEEFA